MKRIPRSWLGAGGGGVPHLLTAGRPKFSSASLRAKHAKARAQHSACLPAAPIFPQTREQTLEGLVKGSGESALGTQPAGGNAQPWGCCPKQDSCSTVLTPACLQAHSQRPGRRHTDQWTCLPATMRCLTHSFPTRYSAGLTGRCRGTDPVPTLPRSFAGTMSTLGLKQHKLNISAWLLSPNHFLSRYYLQRPQQVVNSITCLLQKLAGPYRTKMGKCTND